MKYLFLCLLMGLSLLSTSILAFDPLFDARIDYSAVDNPNSVFSIDLDGDRDNDFVTANNGSCNVSLLLNLSDVTVDIGDNEWTGLPLYFDLKQNYPNPFNPSARIDYMLAKHNHVTITIYNLLGQKVKTLFDGSKPAGDYSITWDGTAGDNHQVASGIYFYKLDTGEYVRSKRMMLPFICSPNRPELRIIELVFII